jgi:hypothetical protein
VLTCIHLQHQQIHQHVDLPDHDPLAALAHFTMLYISLIINRASGSQCRALFINHSVPFAPMRQLGYQVLNWMQSLAASAHPKC